MFFSPSSEIDKYHKLAKFAICKKIWNNATNSENVTHNCVQNPGPRPEKCLVSCRGELKDFLASFCFLQQRKLPGSGKLKSQCGCSSLASTACFAGAILFFTRLLPFVMFSYYQLHNEGSFLYQVAIHNIKM